MQNIKPGAILTNKELLDLFAQSYGPEITDTSDSEYHYVQKINWALYTNPNQIFSSEREFLIGSLIAKFDPELALTLPTIQDVFRVKETSNKLKTKAQKIEFLQQLAEKLRDLPYDTQQLQKVMDFLRTKATEYKIPQPVVPPVTIGAHLMYFAHDVCSCKDCSPLTSLRPTTSLVHPATLLAQVRPALSPFNLPDLQKCLLQFDSADSRHAKNKLAFHMLSLALQHCTNAGDINLTDARLFIFKFHFDETVMAIQFEDAKLHFRSLCDISLAPGEIQEYHVNFLSNIQIVP